MVHPRTCLLVVALAISSMGCASDHEGDGSNHCDDCNLTKIESKFDACVAGCEPDCADLSEAECDAAMDFCVDECDGCGAGFVCGERRGDGAFRCYDRDSFLDICIL